MIGPRVKSEPTRAVRDPTTPDRFFLLGKAYRP